MNRALWTPAQERGRRVRGWYDASNVPSVLRENNASDPPRVVAAWKDLSGFGNTLTRSDSVYRPELGRLNGQQSVKVLQHGIESIAATAPAANPYSVERTPGFVMLCVFRADTVDLGGSINDGSGTYVWDRDAPLRGNPIFSLKVDTSGAWRLQTRGDGGGGLAQSPNLFPVALGRTELVSVRFQYGSAVNTSAWRAGALVHHTDNPSTGPISPELVAFGKPDAPATPNPSLVNVGEWLIINDGNDPRLRQRVEGYLAHKWGVRLASGHPYAFAPPMVGAMRNAAWPLARYSSASISITARKLFGYMPTTNPRLPIIR